MKSPFFILAVVLLAGQVFLLGQINELKNGTLGAVVATTSLSDTIGTFRTNVNTAVTNINTELEDVSSTVITHTTLLALLPVSRGGTGTSTSPTDAQFLSAYGSTPIWKTLSFGGGILSTTTATTVQINTTGVDLTAVNTWTGSQSYSTTTNLTKTNLNGPFILNNLSDGVLLGHGSSAVTVVATGTYGNFLMSSSSGWVSQPFQTLFGATSSVALDTTSTAATDMIIYCKVDMGQNTLTNHFFIENPAGIEVGWAGEANVASIESYQTVTVPIRKNTTYFVSNRGGASCLSVRIGN